MLKKGKAFLKDHRKEIIVVSCIAGGIIIGAVANQLANKKLLELGKMYVGKYTISWVPGEGFMSLERVKSILDANADNSSSFAIFREGLNPKDYTVISIGDGVVIPPVS